MNRGLVNLAVQADLRGRLLRRYKRFFADVETPDGRALTVHCANPGSMRGLLREGAAVRCSTSPNPARKLPQTLEMIRSGRVWVGVHTTLANPFAEGVLRSGVLAPFRGYRELRREVVIPGGSRIDFRLDSHRSKPPLWIEVKSVTLAEGRTARFPDSVTTRGRKHAERLLDLRRAGERAAVLFVVQRGDCERVEPADDIDPDYGEALREAAAGGVEVVAVRARVGPSGIRLERRLPVRL